MRSRQVHLDFHTSELIPKIGEKFNPTAFVERLQAAHVDSITCFARCHHGMLYYPSQTHPELIHPGLENPNLLIEQIDACHAAGIDVPIYTTVQWDHYIMKNHPEWLSVDDQGEYIDTQGVPAPHFYHTICLNSPYRNFFKEHLLDLIAVVGKDKVDGIFMDILFAVDCDCTYCQAEMKELAIDHTIKNERLRYSKKMLHDFKAEISELIWSISPEIKTFYNGSHIGPNDKASLPFYSHLELESLPSGGWGYDHFPITARYARNLGKEFIGMTGKFHTYWGDFHSLKNKAAMEFEVFNMFAQGAQGCSIGDQLHPDGELSKAAYELIGHVFETVEKIEDDSQYASVPMTELALLTPEEFWLPGSDQPRTSPAIIGATRMLQELNYQFDIIDSAMDFSRYQVIILPDIIPYKAAIEDKLQDFIAQGGKVIGTFESLIQKETTHQAFYGIDYLGDGQYERDFILPNETFGKDLPKEEFVAYIPGTQIAAVEATAVLDRVQPYFNREGETFISHQHAPSKREIGAPELTVYGNVYYFAHPIFTLYRKNAPQFIKEILKDVLTMCVPMKQVTHDGPSSLQITANASKEKDVILLHGLHYLTEKKSEDIYTIENHYPLLNVTMNCYVGDRRVQSIVDVINQKAVDFNIENGYAVITQEVLMPHFVYKMVF